MGRLTGQRWSMLTSTSSPAAVRRRAILSVTVYSPAAATSSTSAAPSSPNGDLHAVLEDALRHHAEGAARAHQVAGGGARRELPHLVARQRLGLLAARQEEPVALGDDVQRVLQAVVDLRQQAGPELHREHLADELHRVADRDAGGALEHLHVGVAAAHADDLRDEPDVAEAHVGDLVLAHGGVELDGDEVAAHTHDAAGAAAHSVIPTRASSASLSAMPRPSAASSAAHFSVSRSLTP